MEKAKEVFMWLVAVVLLMMVLAPCLLTFSEGLNGEPTIWNFVGLAYTAFLVWVFWYIKKRRNGKSEY